MPVYREIWKCYLIKWTRTQGIFETDFLDSGDSLRTKKLVRNVDVCLRKESSRPRMRKLRCRDSVHLREKLEMLPRRKKDSPRTGYFLFQSLYNLSEKIEASREINNFPSVRKMGTRRATTGHIQVTLISIHFVHNIVR